MLKNWKKLVIMGFLVFGFLGFSTVAYSSGSDKLLYDLTYDKERNVLTGKTTPNANIFLTNLAGSIVANDKGEFEVPIPKGTKEAMVGMLDAEGDKSTDVRYDFDKGKVIATEETKESEQKKESDDKTKESTEDSGKVSSSNTEETSTSSSNSKSQEIANTASSNQNEKESTEKSTKTKTKQALSILKWILVIVAVIATGGAVWFLWKKKQASNKVKAKHSREKESSKDSSKKSQKKSGKKNSKKKSSNRSQSKKDSTHGRKQTHHSATKKVSNDKKKNQPKRKKKKTSKR
ncbi:hypothetical protein [Vagococcus sp. CY53-2]|uniref:hypothetical protein n=1 Tax=Vagococcus sp. CY53-2 TaxID=2925780 RepID=UPI001F50A002|nr:hypothetical protein [Vagococcus sp. CY53-2]MCI0130359.1 hypothetical protein [Vagococcus sp. CY53-2]